MLIAVLILTALSLAMSAAQLAATLYLLRPLIAGRLEPAVVPEPEPQRSPSVETTLRVETALRQDNEALRRELIEFKRAHGMPVPVYLPDALAVNGPDGPMAERHDLQPIREIR